jgi:hypothetical protein
MGEITTMVEDGILCQVCGSYVNDGNPVGYPRSCNRCVETEESEIQVE